MGHWFNERILAIIRVYGNKMCLKVCSFCKMGCHEHSGWEKQKNEPISPATAANRVQLARERCAFEKSNRTLSQKYNTATAATAAAAKRELVAWNAIGSTNLEAKDQQILSFYFHSFCYSCMILCKIQRWLCARNVHFSIAISSWDTLFFLKYANATHNLFPFFDSSLRSLSLSLALWLINGSFFSIHLNVSTCLCWICKKEDTRIHSQEWKEERK